MLSISNTLITDYSSVIFFDFLHTNNPIIFYLLDIENYNQKICFIYNNFESRIPVQSSKIIWILKNIEATRQISCPKEPGLETFSLNIMTVIIV